MASLEFALIIMKIILACFYLIRLVIELKRYFTGLFNFLYGKL